MQGPLSAGPREPAPRWNTPQMAPVPTAHAASSRQTPGPKASPAPHPDLLTCVGPRPSGRPRAGLGGLCWSARQPSDQADQAEDLHTSGQACAHPRRTPASTGPGSEPGTHGKHVFAKKGTLRRKKSVQPSSFPKPSTFSQEPPPSSPSSQGKGQITPKPLPERTPCHPLKNHVSPGSTEP